MVNASELGPIIEAVDLKESFAATAAVGGISFAIPSGGCSRLLGPNGDGKTTTMRMIMGLARPTGRSMRVLGRAVLEFDRATRARIGLVLKSNTLDPDLPVRRNLELHGHY